jgi:hypothetical protein
MTGGSYRVHIDNGYDDVDQGNEHPKVKPYPYRHGL